MVLWDKIVMNGEKMEIDMKSAKVHTVNHYLFFSEYNIIT